ncbi:MAG: serine protease, partial [Deltaproteobacteria bacterium]
VAPVARPAPAEPAPAARPRRVTADNPYLHKVDEAIRDARVRAAIRAVQPAAVKLGGGSGVNLAPEGLILTNAHVAKRVGARYAVLFPDGRSFSGHTIAVDDTLDLALLSLADAADLPIAPVAKRAPRVGDFVAAIGQPGTSTPDGAPTGYERWHVSTGEIRGFLDDPLGDQSLGRTKHDAWTYWGHSGSPLFNRSGAIVALHNSWDSTTAMRHAVTWQAVVHFLEEHDAHYVSR